MLARRIVDDDHPAGALEGARAGVGIRWRGGDDAWLAALSLVREASHEGLAPLGLLALAPLSAARVSDAAACGITELALGVHGARREVHEWHTGVAGSFDAAIGAMRAARSHRLALGVVTSLTRSNARVLGELPSLLGASGASMWAIVAPRASGEGFTTMVPRIGLGIPAALAALERARRVGLETRLVGMPWCALGPFAAHALPSDARAHGERCAPCVARLSCPGIDALYLARFGEAELHTLTASGSGASRSGLASLLAAADAE